MIFWTISAAFALLFLGFMLGCADRLIKRSRGRVSKHQVARFTFWEQQLRESLIDYREAIEALKPVGGDYHGSRRVSFAYFHHLRLRKDAGFNELATPLILDFKEFHSEMIARFCFDLEREKAEFNAKEVA